MRIQNVWAIVIRVEESCGTMLISSMAKPDLVTCDGTDHLSLRHPAIPLSNYLTGTIIFGKIEVEEAPPSRQASREIANAWHIPF